MRIRWTPPAADDLEHIKQYLTERYPPYAHSTVRTIYESIRSLKTMPYRGRAGLRNGTRELVITSLPYVVAYRILGETIEILHIFHGAQNR